MIVEHVWILIIPGHQDAYESAVREALPFLESAPDCFGAELRRQIEDPNRYLLMIKWASVEAHMAFRASTLFEQWRALTLPHYAQPSEATHFSEVLPR